MADYDKIYIIDSLSAVVAIRILCDTALDMAAKGNTAQEIVEALEELKGRTQIFAAVDTLEYLAKGGRISKAAAAIGDMANLKPIITVSREGSVEVVGKGIGVNRTLSAIQKKSQPSRLTRIIRYIHFSPTVKRTVEIRAKWKRMDVRWIHASRLVLRSERISDRRRSESASWRRNKLKRIPEGENEIPQLHGSFHLRILHGSFRPFVL